MMPKGTLTLDLCATFIDTDTGVLQHLGTPQIVLNPTPNPRLTTASSMHLEHGAKTTTTTTTNKHAGNIAKVLNVLS